jgi:hypothetical protein
MGRVGPSRHPRGYLRFTVTKCAVAFTRCPTVESNRWGVAVKIWEGAQVAFRVGMSQAVRTLVRRERAEWSKPVAMSEELEAAIDDLTARVAWLEAQVDVGGTIVMDHLDDVKALLTRALRPPAV